MPGCTGGEGDENEGISSLVAIDQAPVFKASFPAVCFYVHGMVGEGARAGTLYLPHGPVRTPVFMPVGTKGTLKGIMSRQLTSWPYLDCDIMLANTYHCAIQPTTELLKEMGGLHSFMAWPRNILTDSGGFQMVSLLKLSNVEEEGVTFCSPVDGSKMLLTPEHSIAHQNRIGSDIIMQLDDVISTISPDCARMELAMERSVRWLDHCIAAHSRPNEQNLFAIIQGGLDDALRDRCMDEMLKRDSHIPGYAIGGLSGGEDKNKFWRIVAKCTARLPSNKPRYLMGVGYPLDLVVCTALGCDMFDCVYPTRTARFGVALVPTVASILDNDNVMVLWDCHYHSILPTKGKLKLKSSSCSMDKRPIQKDCPCLACERYSRAQLSALLKQGDGAGAAAMTIHNLCYMTALMRTIRSSVLEGTFPDFVDRFLRTMFSSEQQLVPQWVRDALSHAGIPVDPTIYSISN